ARGGPPPNRRAARYRSQPDRANSLLARPGCERYFFCSIISGFFSSALSELLTTGLSQGIIARNSLPICSIWCSELARRMGLKRDYAVSYSRIQVLAKVPSW